jgi:hypothetical protein
MAKLADALASGASGRKVMGVQVSLRAQDAGFRSDAQHRIEISSRLRRDGQVLFRALETKDLLHGGLFVSTRHRNWAYVLLKVRPPARANRNPDVLYRDSGHQETKPPFWVVLRFFRLTNGFEIRAEARSVFHRAEVPHDFCAGSCLPRILSSGPVPLLCSGVPGTRKAESTKIRPLFFLTRNRTCNIFQWFAVSFARVNSGRRNLNAAARLRFISSVSQTAPIPPLPIFSRIL